MRKSLRLSFPSSVFLRNWFFVFVMLFLLGLQGYAANGAISGRVTDESLNGLANVEVRAYPTGQTYYVTAVLTDGSGYYTLSNLIPGTYTVLFTGDTPGGPTGYIWEFYNDKHDFSTANPVTVTSGATTPNIDAAVAAIPADPYEPNDDFASAYTITPGTYNNIVAETNSSDFDWFKIYVAAGQDLRVATLNGIPVYPEYGLDIDIFLYDSSGNVLAEATSNRADETLYLSNVTAGWYYIWIGYAPPSVFSLSATTGDLGLGEITGHVTNSLGNGVQNVKAYFYSWESLDWSLFHASVPTDASGNFKFASTPGSFRIRFVVDEAMDPYVLSEWYNNQSMGSASTVVSMASDATTAGIDAQLADGAAISGQVTDLGSNPLDLASVIAIDAQAYSTPTLFTDPSGNYTMGHIPVGDGTRKVRFSRGSYAREWWNNKASFGTADSVPLVARQTTTGINGQLPLAGHIAGRVTDSLNNGIGGVNVTVFDTIQNLVPIGSAPTSLDGNYNVGGLPTANVRVFFNAGSSSDFNSEFYTDKITFETADSVSVTAGTTINNIDAQLSAKSIKVTEPDGGEKWCAGTRHKVEWTDTGGVANVKIEYSTDNGRSFTTAIASTPNTGSYFWTVPAISSSLCVIRVSDASNPADYDDINAALTITSNQCRTPSDYNKDAVSDTTVWRPSTGVWYSLIDYFAPSFSATPWGLPSDVPVAGDYDGGSQTDIAVYRPSTGFWYVLPSTAPGTYTAAVWGLPNDVPIPADYDGDGKVDITVYRPSTGFWYILPSTVPGTYTVTIWGSANDVPVPADYDGDGKTDIAVYRPSTGVWFMLPSSVPGTYTAALWGTPGDIPAPGDYDGDFKADIAVWRPTSGVWYIVPSAALSGTYTTKVWGVTGDLPATGDYDADGKADIAVWRPSTGVWYALLSSEPGLYGSLEWGWPTDVPVTSLSRILAFFP